MSLTLGIPSFMQVRSSHRRVLSFRSPVCAQITPSHLVERRSANFKPTVWHDNFIQSISGDRNEGRNMERARKLKEEARQMMYEGKLLKDKLELVDTLQQLGVAYHFKEEIKCTLTEIHESMDQLLASSNDDLHVISLLFRLLRMHGFSVSEEVFTNCIDNKGDFKAKLSSDIKGILNLYEASYLAREGEEILEMARHFTTKYLTDFSESPNCTDSRLKERVAHALELPLNWRMERLHTRWYIDQYKRDEQMRPALLELAVLDFNMIQNSYKRELKDISSWWTDLQLYNKLPFIRDRLVENYFWSVGFDFEPKNSSLRKAQTKAGCFITTIDDIYDVYGSLDELEVFTYAVEQWNVAATETLPEYMQLCFLALFNTINDEGYEVLKEKGLNIIPYLRKAWTDLCKAYLLEARWYHSGYFPTLEEYLENAWVSISGNIVLSNAYCINDYVTAEDLEQFSSGYPDVVRYASMNFRLYNDLATSSAELERGDVTKSIQCYMRAKRVTEPLARQEIKEILWKYWKQLNGNNVRSTAFQEYFRNVALNTSRMAQCIFQHGDGYGEPGGHTKERAIAILFEPFQC